jgi:hypothetical protein
VLTCAVVVGAVSNGLGGLTSARDSELTPSSQAAETWGPD